MLLYTRLAPPKIPKRRSRAGCTYCKEKKKKCDEVRPNCSRCAERGLECTYEAVKPRQPRQRKRQDSTTGSRPEIKSEDGDGAVETVWRGGAGGMMIEDDSLVPLGSVDTASLFAPSTTSDHALMSPVASVGYDFLPLEHSTSATAIELFRRDRRQSSLSSRSIRSIRSELALVASMPRSPRLDFCSPAFSEFSNRPNRRSLVDHFCSVLSHLIVFREESGNPFQQLVLPLSHGSPAVLNAMYALSSAHLEYRGVENGEKSMYFHSQAIQGLARLIQQGAKANKNELLAAIMLLVYYEVLVQSGRSNLVDGHLKGALTIMCSSPEPPNPASIFLERAFRFYDVIAALSFGTAPLSSAPAAGGLTPFPPLDAPSASPLSNVDTLLGMATTLWPIMHRLSTLPALKAEIRALAESNDTVRLAAMRTEFENTAKSIESALEHWQPSLLPNVTLKDDRLVGEDGEALAERARLQSILNNALAYRNSAFVYLYRTIYGFRRTHPLVQKHAHVSLVHCMATVSHAGPMGALLWPLFVAACEATTIEDRDLARRAFFAVERRQGMTNIERAWEIVQEVWRRADVVEVVPERIPRGEDLWRMVSKEMGVTIVFG